MKEIPFGSLVQDKISGFKGFVVYRIEHMHNCVRYGVQPETDKEGQLPEPNTFDGPDLDIIAPPKSDLPPAIKNPNTFKLGVKVKDILTGLTGVAVLRIKYRHAGDRYGIQPPVNGKGEIPKIITFDATDLEQIDPVPKKKKKPGEPETPRGPHDHSIAITR